MGTIIHFNSSINIWFLGNFFYKKKTTGLFYIILTIILFLICTNRAFAQNPEFENAKDVASGSVSGVSSLDVGDLNGDDLGDVIALEGGKHASGRKTFAWFEAPSNIQDSWTRHEFGNSSQLRSFLGSAKLADMDGDGDLDLIVSSDNHSGSSKQADLYVYVNPGSGAVTGTWSFHRVTPSTLALHHINDMEIADMDVDGKLDIVVRSLDPNQIHIFFQNSISSYTKKTIDTNISQSEGLSVGFLDDDNLPDITYTGHWLKSPTNPRTQSYTKLNIDSDYKNINQNTKEAIGDIDGDGKNDVIISPAEAFRGGGNTYLAWYKNPGNTSSNNWEKHIILNTTNNTHTVKLGDIDNDNDLDVVTGIGWSNSVSTISTSVYYNNGSGSFGSAQIVSSNKGLYSGVVYDIEDDGDLDIIGQNIYSNTSKPYVYENLLNTTLGLDDAILEKTISFYPNPSSDNITLEIPTLVNHYSYQIISLNGQVLQRGTINTSTHNLNLKALDNGVYFLKFTSEQLIETIKIIKQ